MVVRTKGWLQTSLKSANVHKIDLFWRIFIAWKKAISVKKKHLQRIKTIFFGISIFSTHRFRNIFSNIRIFTVCTFYSVKRTKLYLKWLVQHRHLRGHPSLQSWGPGTRGQPHSPPSPAGRTEPRSLALHTSQLISWWPKPSTVQSADLLGTQARPPSRLLISWGPQSAHPANSWSALDPSLHT